MDSQNPPQAPLPPEANEILHYLHEQLETLGPQMERMGELSAEAQDILNKRTDIPANFSVDADGLDQMSVIFGTFGNQLAEVIASIEANTQKLQNIGWTGVAAERFQRELTDLVLPTLDHLRTGLTVWKQQTAQMASNVRKVSNILEDMGSKVQSMEQVRDLAANDTILKTVREKMQEELKKAGKLPQGDIPPAEPPATPDAEPTDQ
jgi:uncharacterized protein YukE